MADPKKRDEQSDLEHDRGGPNENAEIDRMKREAANPPMPFDTRTDAERERGEPIPLPAGGATPGATKKDGETPSTDAGTKDKSDTGVKSVQAPKP